MNKNNHPDQNQPSQNGHGRCEVNNEADQFVEALESDSRMIGALDPSATDTYEFGNSIRETVSLDLPERNEGLRDMLIEKLDDDPIIPANSEKPDFKSMDHKPRFNVAQIALAASLLLAVSIALLVTVAPNRFVWSVAENHAADTREQSTQNSIRKSESVSSVTAEREDNEESLKYNLIGERQQSTQVDASKDSVSDDLAAISQRQNENADKILTDLEGIDVATVGLPATQFPSKVVELKKKSEAPVMLDAKLSNKPDQELLALSVGPDSAGQPSINFGVNDRSSGSVFFAETRAGVAIDESQGARHRQHAGLPRAFKAAPARHRGCRAIRVVG